MLNVTKQSVNNDVNVNYSVINHEVNVKYSNVVQATKRQFNVNNSVNKSGS